MINTKGPRQIVEIAFEMRSQEEYNFMETLFDQLGIPYFIEPARTDVTTLDDLEALCNGK